MGRFKALYLAFFISSCGSNGIIFHTDSAVVKDIEQSVNEIINSKCITHELNDYPKELQHMRASSFNVDVLINKPFGKELASTDGEKIYLTYDSIKSKNILINALTHELAHIAGFHHPSPSDANYRGDIHANSFPSRLGNASERCYGELTN